MSQSTLPPQFTALLQGFTEKNGHTAPESFNASGIEIEVEGVTARIYPHGEDEGRFLIDIFAMVLDPDDEDLKPGRWLALHEMNAVTRFTTGWWVVVDGGELILTRTELLEQTNPDKLESLLGDGFERAESLRAGFAKLGEIEPPLELPQIDFSEDGESPTSTGQFHIHDIA